MINNNKKTIYGHTQPTTLRSNWNNELLVAQMPQVNIMILLEKGQTFSGRLHVVVTTPAVWIDNMIYKHTCEVIKPNP